MSGDYCRQVVWMRHLRTSELEQFDPPQIVRFGVFEADLKTGELRKNGVKVPLQGQPFQVFAILLGHSGELVTREELRQKVWPQDTFLDFDHALNTAITKIRIALGDEADNPRFVETLPRRGYRFIGPVDKTNSQAAAPAVPGGYFAGFVPRGSLLAIGVMGIALLLVLGGWQFRRKSAQPLPQLEIVPLTVLSGLQDEPAFSPDGNQVAFTIWDGSNLGIYTTMIGGEKPLQLTSYGHTPAWSPDGQRIAFIRTGQRDESDAIYVVPSLGGTAHRLYAGLIDRTFMHGLSWSPDGKTLAFSERDPNDIHAWITLLSLAESSTRRLTSPSQQDHDFIPAFSPDGATVAFARGGIAGVVNDLFVVPATGGEPKRLTFDNRAIFGVTWTPNGRDLVFSSARGGIPILWRIPASGGTPQPFVGVSNASAPSISSKGDRLAFMHEASHDAIWRIELADEKHPRGPARLVIGTNARKGRPNFSPDGKKIAFESAQAGHLGPSEIWTCNSDGSNCAELTSLQGTAGTARWSPDGRYIAFEFHPGERSEIYVADLDGGPPRLVPTLPGADNLAPNWSRDGRWIYFASNRGGSTWQLWKVPVAGGTPVQITRHGGVYGIESADGRSLYYAKFETPGIWKMPLDGGEETRVLSQSGGDGWYDWALTPNGIYFVNCDTTPRATLAFFEFATHRIVPIVALDKPPGSGLALAPDGRSVLYIQIDFFQWNIMLVKNYR
jgi:Tol biopolymer transport system component/DNA-binding winged helix-turn-helix (wHTH) protein